MSNPIVYSQEEAQELLLEEVLSLEDLLFLESRLEQFVRAEDHEKPVFLRECVRHIWSTSHPEWPWDDPSPHIQGDPDFLRTRNVRQPVQVIG